MALPAETSAIIQPIYLIHTDKTLRAEHEEGGDNFFT